MSNTARTQRRTIAWLTLAIGVLALFVLLNVLSIGAAAIAPERCLSCHDTSERPIEVRESHASIACGSCHGGPTITGKADFAAREVYGMYLRLPVLDGRRTAAVSDAACIKCHDPARPPSEASAVRINHPTCTEGSSCTDCHSRVAHGDSVEWARSYDMFACVSCHMTEAISVECDLCHTERSREERIRTGSFAMTHGATWQKTHGMGDSLACAACHPADKCVDCHGPGVPHEAAFVSNHGEYAQLPDARCTSCHQSQFCTDCHGTPMPHPASFVGRHSKVVEDQGDTSCKTCHAESDCSTCHVMHIHPGNARQSGGG